MRKQKHEATFEVIAKTIHTYLREQGLGLNFKGMNETISHYRRLADNHLADVFEVMTDCQLWNHYFIEVEGFIEYMKEYWLLEVDKLKAYEERANPDSNLEECIKHAEERAKHFKLFANQVKGKRQFFEKAYYHCMEMYKKGSRSMTRN